MGLFTRKNENLNILDFSSWSVYSPLRGEIVPLESVNDSVFAQKMIGDGIAVKPMSDELYSPVSGKVTVVFPTKHAIGIETDNGIRIIIHIGIDTVELNGVGFDIKIKQGDEVKAGQLIGTIDFNNIKKQFDITTMIVVENYKEYTMKCTEKVSVAAGEMLFELKKV